MLLGCLGCSASAEDQAFLAEGNAKVASRTLTVVVPANAAALAELGVVFTLSGASTSSAYIDSITY